MNIYDAIREVLPALPNGTYCQCQGEHDCKYCEAVRVLREAVQPTCRILPGSELGQRRKGTGLVREALNEL